MWPDSLTGKRATAGSNPVGPLVRLPREWSRIICGPLSSSVSVSRRSGRGRNGTHSCNGRSPAGAGRRFRRIHVRRNHRNAAGHLRKRIGRSHGHRRRSPPKRYAAPKPGPGLPSRQEKSARKSRVLQRSYKSLLVSKMRVPQFAGDESLREGHLQGLLHRPGRYTLIFKILPVFWDARWLMIVLYSQAGLAYHDGMTGRSGFSIKRSHGCAAVAVEIIVWG